MSFLTPVWNYVDALVHPAAQNDALTAARHRAFIAPRLIGSFAALASFPVYLAFRGVPSLLETFVFAWLVAPILIAYFLSRTGLGLLAERGRDLAAGDAGLGLTPAETARVRHRGAGDVHRLRRIDLRIRRLGAAARQQQADDAQPERHSQEEEHDPTH